MGLKFTDALKLSTTSIVRHKGRSVIIVLTISALFGVLMALNFLMNGIEKTAMKANTTQLDGQVYVISELASQSVHSGRIVNSAQKWEEEFVVEPVSERTRREITERAKKYHGEIVGEAWDVQIEVPFRIVTLDAVKDLLDVDINSVPEGKVPILVRQGEAMIYDAETNAHLEEVTEVVGTYPGMKREKDPDSYDGWSYHPTLSTGNPLNIVLKRVDAGGTGYMIIVDDGSGKVEKFLRGEVEWTLANGSYSVDAERSDKALVLRFNNQEDAINYDLPRTIIGVGFPPFNPRFSNIELFGGVLYTASEFNSLRLKLLAVEFIIIIVAVVIATMTFKHLIEQDSVAIALYRSMGATTGNLYLVYFLYILELCLLAVVACIVIAFALVGIMALLNGKAVGERLQAYYQLSSVPKVYFWKFDQYFWTVVVSIIVVAPLSFGFSSHCFKESYLARKLKED